LQDEQLLTAETAAATVQSVVEKIRREQPVAVFVMPEVFADLTDVSSTGDGNDLSWAGKRLAVQSLRRHRPYLLYGAG
jgi:hypothetical protein